MKKLIGAAFLAVACMVAAMAVAQTGTLPAASPASIVVPFSDASCTSTNTCAINVYYQQGSCPSTLAGSSGWTLAGTSALPGAGSLTITSGIQSITQYAVVVEASPSGSSSSFSGPSACSNVTTPFHPNPPVIGTISAT